MLSICNYDIGNIRMYDIHRNTYFLNINKEKTILNTYYFNIMLIFHCTHIFKIFEYYNSTIN
jgi:hypothetical protein